MQPSRTGSSAPGGPAPHGAAIAAINAAAAAAAASSIHAASSSAAAAASAAPSSSPPSRPPPLGVGALPFHVLCTLFDKLERTQWAPRGAAAAAAAKKGPGKRASGGPGRMERCSKLLSSFFDRCAALGGDPHGLLILLLPDADLDRRFDCKETTLVQLLLKGFGINKTRTGEALTNWRTGANAAGGGGHSAAAAASSPLHPREGQGDLSLTILSLMATYCSGTATLSVAQVNGWLDRLAARSQWTSQAFKDGLVFNQATLRADEQPSLLGAATAAVGGALDDPASESASRLIFQLYSRCTSLESKWLTRILLRDLKVGLSARVYMDAFHPHLYAIWLRRGNLKESCSAVRMLMCAEHHAPAPAAAAAAATVSSGKQPSKRKRADSFDPAADSPSDNDDEDGAIDDSDPRSLLSRLLAPSVGSFVQVMLCARAHSLPFAEAKLAGREVSVSEKFDGERVQIHVWRNQCFPGEPPLQQPIPDSTSEETWVAPDCPFSVRIFSRSARNSTLARSGCIPYLLASLGLIPMPSRCTPSPEPPPAAAAYSSSVAPRVKHEGELLKMEDEPMMPPLETSSAFAAPGTSAFYPPAASAAALAVSPPLPFVPSFAASAFRSGIFDGELLVFNELSQTIEPFGGLGDLVPRGVPRAGISGAGNRHRLVFEHRHHVLMLFDLMHLNGESLLNHPLHSRLMMLQHCIALPIPHFVQVVEHTVIRMPGQAKGKDKANAAAPVSSAASSSNGAATSSSSSSAAAAASSAAPTLHSLYLTSLALKQEGLILKDAQSRYIPAHRGSWLKLKRDYIAGFGDSIDLCIVGGVWGMGKGGGVLSTFTLAARRNDPPMGIELRPPPGAIVRGSAAAAKAAAAASSASDDSPDPPSNPLHFQVLFDVGIGLNSSELRQMHHLLVPLMRPYSPRKDPCPPWLRLPKGYKVDMLLRDPARAVVVEVLGSGFIGGILRFPRILRVKIGHGCDYTQGLDLEQYLAIASRADRRLDGEERSALEQKMQESSREQSERARETGRLPHPPARESRFSRPQVQPAAAAAATGPFPWLPPGRSASSPAPQLKSESKPIFFPSSLAPIARPASALASPAALASAAPIDLTSSPIRPQPIPRRSPILAAASSSAAAAVPTAAVLPVSSLQPRGSGVLDFAVSLFEESQSMFPASLMQLQDEVGDAEADDSPMAAAAHATTRRPDDSATPGTGDEMEDADDASADSYCSIDSSRPASLDAPLAPPTMKQEASVKIEPVVHAKEPAIKEESMGVKQEEEQEAEEERKDSQSEAAAEVELSSQPSLCLSFGSSHDSNWHEPVTPVKREPPAVASASSSEQKSDGKCDRSPSLIDALVSVKVEPTASLAATPSKAASKRRPRKKQRSSRPLRPPPPLLHSPPGFTSPPPPSAPSSSSAAFSAKPAASLQSDSVVAPAPVVSASAVSASCAPPLCNPKKSWECRRSFAVEGASRRLQLAPTTDAAADPAMSSAAASIVNGGLCACRRNVWLEASLALDPIARQFLEVAGFVLHTLPATADDEGPALPLPSIVMTQSTDLAAIRARLARCLSCCSTPPSTSASCSPPATWIVASAAFVRRLRDKLDSQGGVAKMDSRASRKLLYSALAQCKIGDSLQRS